MAILLLVILIIGVICLALYGFSARVRAAAGGVHLGWVGLFLISLTWLYAAWPNKK